MMKLIKLTLILLGATFVLCSCIKEELLADSSIPDGKTAMMKLSLSASFMGEVSATRAGLPTAEENKFKDVRVMIFSSNGGIVTNNKIAYTTAVDNPKIEVNTYSGSGFSLYIIANVVDAIDAKLGSVKNIDELNAIEATATELGNAPTNKPLIMTGGLTGLEIAPGSNTIQSPIKMDYMVAKLTLKVVDATPNDHSVTIVGWDIENTPENSFLILNGGKTTQLDANHGKEMTNDAWITTTESLMPFDKIENKTAHLTQYLFENRRGGRVYKALPVDRYPNMDISDGDHRGKAHFSPRRATCIVIHAVHKTPVESKLINARIFIGRDNHSNYDIVRGLDYQFTVTVKGINDIKVDTNIEHANGSFAVHHSAPSDQMDSHPDFLPFMISAEGGMVSIEIIDSQGRTYSDQGFDATWVKVSPLNLMYHQVRQAVPNDEWQQQAGAIGSFVRPKYIPHKSVRDKLTTAGKSGWNTPSVGKEDDDEMTFADATYRMCYKVTDIQFAEGVVTNKMLYVYADEFLNDGSTRSAQVKISFKRNGFNVEEESPIITITQNGYLSLFDERKTDVGLTVLNENGTMSTGVKQKFAIERYEELKKQMSPGVSASVQNTHQAQWGFFGTLLYGHPDKYRNGYFLTANAVYTDVIRTNNQPLGFGMQTGSYRPMHGNLSQTGSVPNYVGSTSGPYYYPDATSFIYHPIYKSSVARYCHEKNRDLNGDGNIDDSETHWYLPALQELQLLYISNIMNSTGYYTSSTESTNNSAMGVHPETGQTGIYDHYNKKSLRYVRCVRKL